MLKISSHLFVNSKIIPPSMFANEYPICPPVVQLIKFQHMNSKMNIVAIIIDEDLYIEMVYVDPIVIV